uniref:U2 small nuclear ribonucleoprotein A n=1 Tax=Ditylenchus dipsaci TaxID=166011 RepID=A0A915CT40_9BILA
MVRLSVDVFNETYHLVNETNQREICLRSMQMSTIENLGVIMDQFDVEIDKGIGGCLPNLKTLALTNNELAELADINPLVTRKKLEHLTMVGNPVAHKTNYRLHVIHVLKNVRVLYFEPVKDKEREAAKKLFGPTKNVTSLSKNKDEEMEL